MPAWREGDDGEALRRFRELSPGAPREAWFGALRAAIAERYLRDPDDPYRMSGRSRGAARWEETRRCIADAVHRGGHFLDVGCANGLLLESLMGWAAERGHRLVPHGLDLVPELLPYARRRLPEHAANFHAGNAWDWQPPRSYDFVRTNLEYVRDADRAESLRRLYQRALAPGGRLVVCHYAGEDPLADVAGLLRSLGWPVAGESGADRVAVAWTDRVARRVGVEVP